MDRRTEIPDQLYAVIYEKQVKIGIDSGLWVDDARRAAAEMMRNTYVARSSVIQCEFQADRDAYIDDEMSVGGRRYRERR